MFKTFITSTEGDVNGMTDQQKATPFDLTSCMAMMEEMMGGQGRGCDCAEMMSQMTGQQGGCAEMMSQMMAMCGGVQGKRKRKPPLKQPKKHRAPFSLCSQIPRGVRHCEHVSLLKLFTVSPSRPGSIGDLI